MNDRRTITILKEDEVYGRVVSGDTSIMEGLYQHFGIYIQNRHFNPKVKNGLWDGKIRFVQRNGRFYLGIFPLVKKYLKSQKSFTLEVDPSLKPPYKSKKDFQDQFMSLIDSKLVSEITPRYYQWRGAIKGCYHERAIIEHCTGSGKSLVITMCAMYLLEHYKNAKILILVPKKDLVEQLSEELIKFGIPADFVGKYVGYQKDEDEEIIIGTWQSCCRNPEFMKKFTALFADECHGLKADVVRSVAEGMTNAHVRLGFTATVPDHNSERYLIEGVLGPVVDQVKTEELQEKGHVAKIKIQIPYLNYCEQEEKILNEAAKIYKKESKNNPNSNAGKKSYQFERDLLQKHSERNKLIAKISKKLTDVDKNVLILVNKINHCDLIKNAIQSMGIDPYVVTGEIKDMKERNRIRKELELSGGNVIIATTGVYSTGVSIKRLNAVIFADAGKSKIQTLQSIGRGLRLHNTKKKLLLFDIADNTKYGNSHLEQRMEFYATEGYNIEVKEIYLDANIS